MKHCKLEEHAWVIVIASLHFCRRNFLDLSIQLTPSFEVDPLLKRTFLYAIPVWELDKIFASNEFNICDVCVALVTFCSRNVVPADKVSHLVETTFELIRHYIVTQTPYSPEDFLGTRTCLLLMEVSFWKRLSFIAYVTLLILATHVMCESSEGLARHRV